MNITRITLCLFLVAGLLLLLGYTGREGAHAAPYIRDGKVDMTMAIAHFSERIFQRGVEEARGEYLRVGSGLPASEAHPLSHAFGEALYTQKGEDGVAWCGDEFSYGCFHQFTSVAIHSKGFSMIASAALACEEYAGFAAVSCIHGIGHGVVGYLGYTIEHLAEAVKVCEMHVPRNPAACVSGVIMEYNLRRMLASDTGRLNSPRPLTGENRYSPCDFLDSRYDMACGFELPLWWFYALDGLPDNERFRTLGEYCNALVGNKKRACMQGIGYVAAFFANLESVRAAGLCVQAVSSAEHDRFECALGIVGRLRSTGEDIVPELCGRLGFSAELNKQCLDVVARSQ